MPETEHRYAELQRGDGRTLRGKAVVYGDLAQIGTRRERFAPGGVRPERGDTRCFVDNAARQSPTLGEKRRRGLDPH